MSSNPAVRDTSILDAHDCWALLRSVSVGRLAVWNVDHPDIFPVNYAVDHSSVVFRTGEGTKLAASLGELPVAFEADGVAQETGIAWSVVLKGHAALLNSTEDVLDSFGLMLFPWQAGRKDAFVRITPSSVTGRRFAVSAPAQWWSAQSGVRKTATE